MNEPVRSESPDARAWWTLAVVVVVVLVAYLGVSAGMMSSSSDEERPASNRVEGVAAETPAGQSARSSTASSSEKEISDADSANRPTRVDSGPTRDSESGSEPLDAQSLREFGELGVLPGLFDDFSSVPDCDFDDALSTCQ